MNRRMTNEEKVAKKLSDIVSDLRIDLDLVGVYLARAFPNSTLRRLNIVAEAGLEDKEKRINYERWANDPNTIF
jgi:hypothetical protein